LPVSHKPISNVSAPNGANSHRAVVSVPANLNAFNGPPGNKIEQRVRCFLTAAIALLVAAKLIRLRRVHPEYENSGRGFDGVAVDNGCLSNNVIGEGRAAYGECSGVHQ
jgi:hypothetical protein